MPFPVVAFATDYGDANVIPSQPAGPLASWTSHGGRVFTPVPGMVAAGLTYEPAGWLGSRPAVRSDGTGALTTTSAVLAGYVASSPNKPWCFVVSIDFVTAGPVTANILSASSSSSLNPFVNFGIHSQAPGVYQEQIRNDTGLPTNGVNGRVGVNTTGPQILTYIRYSSTNGDTFKGGVSLTGGVGFSMSEAGATTLNLVNLFCLYRPTNTPTFGSVVNGRIYRWVLGDGAPNAFEQSDLETWVAAPPDPPVLPIGVKPLVIVAGGTSSQSGSYGLPSPSTDNYIARAGVILGCATVQTAQNGTSSFKMNPTGWVPPSWLDPAQYPDPARNVTNLVNLALAQVALGNQPVCVLHQGPEVVLFDTCVALDPTLTWPVYLAQVVANWNLQRAALQAAGLPYVMVCSSQASDLDTPPQFINRLDLYAAARANEDGYWWNTWPIFAADDLTADPAYLFDLQHPNLAGQQRFAVDLARRIAPAQSGYLPKEWHMTISTPPGAGIFLPSTSRYLSIEESL